MAKRDVWVWIGLIWVFLTLAAACDGHDDDGRDSPSQQTYLRKLPTHRHLQDDDDDDEECGFREPSEMDQLLDSVLMAEWRSRNVFDRRNAILYDIPVYFHVVQPNFYSGLVPDSRIDRYVKYLNDAFRNSNAPFYFSLQYTTRIIHPDFGDCGDHQLEERIKRRLKKGGAAELNVYICTKLTNHNGASLSGYAYLPGPGSHEFVKDGVVLSRSDSVHRSNTLVHEVGHWLGLYHTFGRNTCDPISPGDGVSDTPQHISDAHAVNCHTHPRSWDTCPNLPGKDPVDNYMTYSTDNLCRTTFTPGQVERMRGQYELYRLPYVPPPTPFPTQAPSPSPSSTPSVLPSSSPSSLPSVSEAPTPAPTTGSPSASPSDIPSTTPTTPPTQYPTQSPSSSPSESPSAAPSNFCLSFMTRCSLDIECCSKRCNYMEPLNKSYCWI